MEAGHQRRRQLFGTTRPPAASRALRAGKLEARLEAGNLRYVTFDGWEVLRAIAYVIRDENWGTYAPRLEHLVVEEEEGRFRVAYDAWCEAPSAALSYHAEILGSADGSLSFTAEARPDGDFPTNRCGFAVLHPIEGVAGAPVTVEHVDGAVEETSFPALIDPWQPFKEIRALTHEVGGLFRASCRLEGGVFEMEDHRNWSDASFKTYVRPLAWPWPYVMESGKTDRQAVTLTLAAQAGAESRPGRRRGTDGGRAVSIAVLPPEGASSRHPDIGLVVAPEEVEATLASLEVVGAVAPQAILCHYDPTAGHDNAAMQGFARLQAALPADYLLECVVAAEGDLAEELTGVAQAVEAAGLSLSAVAVCPSVDRQSTPPGSEWPACPPLAEVYAAARAAFPSLPLGGGMFSYFTELNRKRPPVALLDFVTHATCPIVHAADDESVMETLEALPHIFASARAIIGEGTRYHIGPSTIAMRQNPYGARTMDNPGGERICMAHTDPRHFGLFGAAWTIGYAARISKGAPALHVPAAAAGPRGLVWQGDVEGRDGAAGALRLSPVGLAARFLAEIAGSEVLPCRTSDPRRALALAAKRGDRRTMAVANLTATPIEVSFPGLAGPAAGTVELLDAATWGRGLSPAAPRRRAPWRGEAVPLDAFAAAVLQDW